MAMCVVLTLACVLVATSLARGDSPQKSAVSYDVRVAVSLTTRLVDVRAIVEVPDSWSAPTVWLYADRLRDRPPSFDEFEAERIFPIGIETGGYEALTIRVAGCPEQRVGAAPPTPTRARRGRDILITVCKNAEHPLHVELDGKLRLPRRYGTLGVANDTVTLGDPWYPLILETSDAAVPPLADVTVHVAPVLEGDARAIVASGSGVVTVDAEHPVARVEQRGVTHAPIVILPEDRAYVTDRVAAVDLSFVTNTRERDVRHLFPVEGFEPAEQGDHWDVDAAGFVHGTLLDCVGLLRRMGFVAQEKANAKARGIAPSLVVVEVPERQRIAVPVPGMLLVSDHVFRLFPWNRTRAFHGRVLARHAFAALIAPHLAATTAHADSPWAPDLDGALLSDLLVAEAGARKEQAKSLISFAAFHPSIDQLLYAPRVAFGPALFGAIEEPDPDRNGATRARNQIPFGQFVAEKLRDRLGTKLARAMARHFYRGERWRDAAQAESDHDLSYFWSQWIGPHRKVAYRIRRAWMGDDGVVQVVVERLGESWLREPVVVEVEDEDGKRTRQTWDAPGARVIMDFHVASLDRAIVDPDGRLAQDPTLADNHPRFDDETTHAWRPPVFSQFGASYAATERRFDFEFDFAVRRKFDVDRGWGFAGKRDARGYGGSLRWFENFGRLRDLNNRVGQWTLGMSFLRAPNGFGQSPEPLWQFSAWFALAYETRLQVQDPRSGEAGSLYVMPSIARKDDGTRQSNVTVGVRTAQLFWETMRSTTAVLANVGTVVGPALETQYLGIASRNELRGFEADELLARTRGYVIVEQRLKVLTGFFANQVNATWAKSFEVVPFGAIAAVTTRASAIDLAHVVGELGLALRMHHDYFGVQPGVFALDFAVPIGRPDACVRDDAGTCVRERQKFGLYFSAQQTF